MSGRRHERTYARRSTVQVLYTSEIQNEPPSVLLESGRCIEQDEPLSDYALKLIKGVEENRAVIDEQLESTSENWTVARMPILDRTILRLATYEMMFVKDVPISVSINEAVELAKDFGGEDDSPRFVNGVLGRIAKRLEAERAGRTASDAPAEEAENQTAQQPAAQDLSSQDEAASSFKPAEGIFDEIPSDILNAPAGGER